MTRSTKPRRVKLFTISFTKKSAEQFLALMVERQIEEATPRKLMHNGCLLCSEHEPDHCHRRQVAEYLADRLGSAEVRHLPQECSSRRVPSGSVLYR